MKSKFLLASACFLMFLMINNFAVISPYYSDIIPRGTIQVDKSYLDVNEPAYFWVDQPKNILSIAWFFHDGSEQVITQDLNITHQFKVEGKYLVTVLLFGTGGIMQQSTIEITVENLAPYVEISIPQTALEDELVTISVGTWNDSPYDTNSLFFQWLLGDSTTANGSTIHHSWAYAGTYPVTLTAFDDQMAVGYDYTFITILNKPPTAVIGSNPPSLNGTVFVIEDDRITFSAYNSTDTVSDFQKELKYFWDFGDEVVAKGIEVDHAYHESGTYGVTLTVMDDDGAKDAAQLTVIVQNGAPTIDMREEEIIIEEGTSYIFTAIGNDTFTDYNQLQYNWSFGQQGWRASHLWTDDWNGTVSVQVRDPEGATAMQSMNVEVLNMPPSIQINSAYLQANLTLSICTIAGQSFDLNLYEENNLISNITVKLEDCRSCCTSKTILLTLDLSKSYQLEVKYSNGTTPCGWTTASLTYTFRDSTTYTLCHTFGYGNRKPWITNPAEIYPHAPIRFNGSIFDPGMDDINATIQLKTYINIEIDFFLARLLDILHFFPFSYEFDLSEKVHIKVDGWMTKDDIIHIAIEGITNLTEIVFQNEGTWPTTIPFSVMSRIPNLDFMELIDLINIELFGFTFLDINVTRSEIILEAHVADDDGGVNSCYIQVINSHGQLVPVDLAPTIILPAEFTTYEETPLDFFATFWDYGPNPISTIAWDFGDGTSAGGANVTHSFPAAGTYLVRCAISDGTYTSVQGITITIQNVVPLPFINAVPRSEEDVILTFSTMDGLIDTPLDQAELQILWDFGDGFIEAGAVVEHAYPKSGNYTITLLTIDNNGVMGIASQEITIEELPPMINGPFAFQSIEGNLLIAQVAVDDSILDSQHLQFLWFLENASQPVPTRIFSQWYSGANLTTQLVINDTLSNVYSQVNLSFHFLNVAPICIVSNQILYGVKQLLTLRAYALDSFLDIGNLVFTWHLENNLYIIPGGVGHSSELNWTFQNTSLYSGFVEVSDGKSTYSAGFSVAVTLDADGDNIIDEVERQQETAPNSTDTDGDFITDWYEWNVYGTSPISPDTDQDGLFDGLDPMTGKGELFLGTDPLHNDTDYDNLTDGFEVFGWEISVQKIFPANGTTWVHTYNATSNPLLIDSDQDNLTDWEEWYYTKIAFDSQKGAFDPLKVDTDEDGLGDWEEFTQGIAPGIYDTDKDGVSDAAELKGYEVTLWNGTRYHVTTNYIKIDTDDDGLNDWEERYPGTDGRITDAVRPDTDMDGLNDSAEQFSLERGYSQRENILYNLASYYTGTSFFFYAALGNHAKNATLLIGISTASESDLTFSLMAFKLGKSPVILKENIKINTTHFYFNTTEITHYTTDFSGLWFIHIRPASFDLTDPPAIMLEYFKIQVTYPLDPINPDVDRDGLTDGQELNPNAPGATGWITNPKLKDTDADGWSDFEETILRGTNPLSQDTDGDGAKDSVDRDPLHNLILEINVSKAHLDTLWFSPLLAVVVGIDTGTIVTRYQLATEDPAGAHYETAVFNMTYYLDVSDKQDFIQIHLALWKIWFSNCGEEIFSQTKSYQVGGCTWENPQWLSYTSGSNWARIHLRTLWLERANTIAIYSEGNLYNNHYSSLERVNVIILDVEQTGGLFIAGKNTLIIPTSLYTHTQLHAAIEQSVDAHGQIDMNKLPNCLKGDPDAGLPGANFIGVNREEGSVIEHIDSLITREQVSLADAEAILNLLLHNETGAVINSAIVGRAETLGIADDVLEIVPWDSKTYINSPQGKLPQGFLGWIWEQITSFFKAIWDFFVWLFEKIVEIGLWLIGLIAQAVMKFIELAVKLIILVFLFILFAIMLLVLLIAFGLSLIGIMIISPIIGMNITFIGNGFKIDEQNHEIISEIIVTWEYNEFLDLPIPVIITRTRENNNIYFEMKIGSSSVSWTGDINQIIIYILENYVDEWLGSFITLEIYLGVFTILARFWGEVAALAGLALLIIIVFPLLLVYGYGTYPSISLEILAFQFGIITAAILELSVSEVLVTLGWSASAVKALEAMSMFLLVIMIPIFIITLIIWLSIGEYPWNES